MSIPANQEEFDKFFRSGSEIISLKDANKVVASLLNLEFTNHEVRMKFWREFRPLAMVGQLLGQGISIRYTGLTNQQFDAVLYSPGGLEHIVECVSIDNLGRHYQDELIKQITHDGSWNPERVVLRRKKSGEIYYRVINEEERPDVETKIVGACASICQQLYKKLCNEKRIKKDGQRLLQSKISYYVFTSCEPPVGMCMFDDITQVIFRQLHLLSLLTSRRLFFVGRDHVIDSEMKR